MSYAFRDHLENIKVKGYGLEANIEGLPVKLAKAIKENNEGIILKNPGYQRTFETWEEMIEASKLIIEAENQIHQNFFTLKQVIDSFKNLQTFGGVIPEEKFEKDRVTRIIENAKRDLENFEKYDLFNLATGPYGGVFPKEEADKANGRVYEAIKNFGTFE